MGNAQENRSRQLTSYLEYLQYIFGLTKVTLGDPFDDEALKPLPDRDKIMVGVYVQDVDLHISGLYKEIDEWEQS